MKVRVRQWQIQQVIMTYQNYSDELTNTRLLSPAFLEIIKQKLLRFQSEYQRNESNPAFLLPIVCREDNTHNRVLISLDISNVLIIDEFG
jgi:hypothetical protein